MRVTLKCHVDKDDTRYDPGDVVDLDDGLATVLIERGDAEAVAGGEDPDAEAKAEAEAEAKAEAEAEAKAGAEAEAKAKAEAKVAADKAAGQTGGGQRNGKEG
jgi:hypothetical protein